MTLMVLDVRLPQTELVHSNQDLGQDASSARSPDCHVHDDFLTPVSSDR